MFSRTSKLTLIAVVAMLVAVVPAFAGRAITMKATLVTNCDMNCQTTAGGWDKVLGFTNPTGSYSMLKDFGDYFPSALVQSEILTHNSVYTLDTLDTLQNGVVGGSTRFVRMNFYTTVDNALPACWNGPVQNQAVNWSIFSENSMSFTEMNVGQTYPGHARIDFNVRNTTANCNTQVFRFWGNWYWSPSRPGVLITRTGANTWEVTTDQYGTMELMGQGGRKGQTQPYGEFRMPFKLLLEKQ